MDLTIIIVNWNGGTMLTDCLASVVQTRGDLNLQVLVVDNASRDGSREAAQKQFPQFEIFNSGSNLGFGRANNLVRERVKSDLVLFLNPDTILLENSLQQMTEFLRSHPEMGALGCKMRTNEGEIHDLGLQYFPSPLSEFLKMSLLTAKTMRRFRRWLPYLDPNQSAYVTKLYGGCLLCQRSALDRVGWFDERYFMYAEDADLCKAIINDGKKLYYLSSVEIIHISGGTSDKAPSGFSLLMQCESIGKYIAKHGGAFAWWRYRAGLLLGALFRLVVVFILRVVSYIVPSASNGVDLQTAFAKCQTVIFWSLGLKKPAIGK